MPRFEPGSALTALATFLDRAGASHAASVLMVAVSGKTDMAESALHAYGSNLALRMQPTGTTAGLARMVRTAIVRKRPRVIYPRAYFFMRWVTPIVRWFLDNFSPALKEA